MRRIRQLAWICTLNSNQLRLPFNKWWLFSPGSAFLPQSFNVVGSVGAARKVRQVKLNLIPAFVQAHGHRANERLDTRGALVVGSAEAAAHILIVEDLHFEREVFFQL